tara:strand:- start:29536 stop:30597 length:1062 start_codon:yes stop_codon:yes gene_type:complete
MNIEALLAKPILKPIDTHFEAIRNELQAQNISCFKVDIQHENKVFKVSGEPLHSRNGLRICVDRNHGYCWLNIDFENLQIQSPDLQALSTFSEKATPWEIILLAVSIYSSWEDEFSLISQEPLSGDASKELYQKLKSRHVSTHATFSHCAKVDGVPFTVAISLFPSAISLSLHSAFASETGFKCYAGLTPSLDGETLTESLEAFAEAKLKEASAQPYLGTDKINLCTVYDKDDNKTYHVVEVNLPQGNLHPEVIGRLKDHGFEFNESAKFGRRGTDLPYCHVQMSKFSLKDTKKLLKGLLGNDTYMLSGKKLAAKIPGAGREETQLSMFDTSTDEKPFDMFETADKHGQFSLF